MSYQYGGQHIAGRYPDTPYVTPSITPQQQYGSGKAYAAPADQVIPFACNREGGRIKFPDGAQLFPGQCIVRPDGRTVRPAPDGSMIADDQGTILLPDMSIIFTDGSRIYPDGHIDQTAAAPPRTPKNLGNALQRTYDVPVGALKFADGTFKFPNGVTSYPDGSLRLPDGSTMLPGGQLVYPDGTHALELRDGSYRLTDGTLFQADGSLKFRDGTVQTADGNYDSPPEPPKALHVGPVVLPHGMIQMPDGSVQMPDGSVQLTDGRLMYPDGTIAQANPDGSYHLFDGSQLQSDGCIKEADGRYKYPDGSIRHPDGGFLQSPTRGIEREEGLKAFPEGAVHLEGTDSWQFPNGLIWNPDESVTCPDGSLRTLDDMLTRPDGQVVGPNVDGEFHLTDGSWLCNDNSLRMPDGTTKRADGSLKMTDGTEHMDDGSTRFPDGTMRLANGNIILPDYSIQFPNGQVRLPNGASRGAHGTIASRNETRHEDPRLGGSPFVEWQRLPDGSMRLPNGFIQYPDGNVKLPDGSIKMTDGRIRLPNDSISPQLQNGTHLLSDGTHLLPDGTIKLHDGRIRQLDGSLRCADGSVVGLDGKTHPPGWPAPKLLSPLFSGPKVPTGSHPQSDGSYRLPNGMTQHPDNSVTLPDGSLRTKSGNNVILPNGQNAEQAHDGSYWLSDQSLLLADGSLRYPDSSVLFPDGSMQRPNGEIHTADGQVLPPGASVPRTAIPAFSQNLRPLTPAQMPDLPRGSIRLRNGAYKLPNGMVYYPDGRLGLPDGSIKHGDGRVQMPDGTWVLPQADGSLLLADESRLFPDGSIVYNDGRMKYPDGTEKKAPARPQQPSGASGAAGSGAAATATPPPEEKPKKKGCFAKLCPCCPCCKKKGKKASAKKEEKPKDEKKKKGFCAKFCGCCPCCKKKDKDKKDDKSSKASTKKGDQSTRFANGVSRQADGKTHKCPDGSTAVLDNGNLTVTNPSGSPVTGINGLFELSDGTRLTNNLGIRYTNGVTKETDGSVTCPERSVRQAPPNETKLTGPSGSVQESKRKLFDLTDGTQLLPNLGIRGTDKIITNTDGTRERPTIGADIAWLDDGRGGRDNVCVIQSVTPGGPFDKAGIQADDICESWDGAPLDGKRALVQQLETAIPGEVANIQVSRNRQSLGSKAVTVGSTSQLVRNAYTTQSAASIDPGTAGMRPWFGAQIKFVDELETGKRDNLAQIHNVDVMSPASKAGLIQDDVIRYWDGTLIDGEAIWKSKIRSAQIGQQVKLGVIRAGRNMQMDLVIEGTNKEKGAKQRVASAHYASTS